MARLVRYFLLFPLFMVLAWAGCKAQNPGASPALSPQLVHRIQTEIRSRYSIPPQIDISIGDPKPGDFSGYDNVPVTFTGGTHKVTHEFLLSRDRKTLAHLEKIDISQDLMSKIDVKGRPVRGNPNARITIINYDDFECPFCSRMHATLFPTFLKQYGDKVKVIYKDYPLVEIHPWAMHAAVDGNCLAAQNNDAYWDFADYVHANQREITAAGQGDPKWTGAFTKLDAIANERVSKYKLDQPKVDACMKKQDETAVRASMAEADNLGVDSTPTMFIDGQKIAGILSEDQLRSILDRELADAGDKAPSSTAKK